MSAVNTVRPAMQIAWVRWPGTEYWVPFATRPWPAWPAITGQAKGA